jgi:hypothetical protein
MKSRLPRTPLLANLLKHPPGLPIAASLELPDGNRHLHEAEALVREFARFCGGVECAFPIASDRLADFLERCARTGVGAYRLRPGADLLLQINERWCVLHSGIDPLQNDCRRYRPEIDQLLHEFECRAAYELAGYQIFDPEQTWGARATELLHRSAPLIRTENNR